MASRKVIQDSDDDCDVDASPGNSSAKADAIIQPSTSESLVTPTSMIQTSSTDPVLFQAIYEQHLGAIQQQSFEPSQHEESPIFDFIQEVHMSSSDDSGRKLKRSKTVNMSSLNSINESVTSNRNAKRANSTRDIDDLTQITSPRTSENVIEGDSWAFPNGILSNYSTQLISEGKDTKGTWLKTYSHAIRRSQTMAYAPSSPPNESILQKTVGEDIGSSRNFKRTLESQREGDLPPVSANTKRHKKNISGSADALDNVIGHSANRAYMDELQVDMDALNANARPHTSERPSFTSSASRDGTDNYSNDPFVGNNTQIPGTTDPPKKGGLLSTYSANQNSVTSKSAIVVISNSLTDEQKSQYQLVSVESSLRSRPSSQPEMVDIVETDSTFLDGSSTVLKDTLSTYLLPANSQPSASVILLSSPQLSLPNSTANRKMKRAKSDVALKEPTSSAFLKSSSKATKRLKRNKTVAHSEAPLRREGSVDELSFTPPRLEKTSTRKLGVKKDIRREIVEDRDDRGDFDELFGSDEVGLPAEHYQPRPSVRRSKSMLIPPLSTLVDVDLGKPRKDRRKAKHITGDKSASIMRDANSVEDANEDIDVTPVGPEPLDPDIGDVQKEHSTKEPGDSANVRSIIVTPAEVENYLAVPTTAAQPKRRGRPRKKTSEFISNESDKIPNNHLTESNTTVLKVSDKEATVLQETDHNEVSPGGPSSALLTRRTLSATEIGAEKCPLEPKEATHSMPLDTPKREVKRGPDQHSPLQNGKMSYRVGLSKKTRIAPLLKVIRKP